MCWWTFAVLQISAIDRCWPQPVHQCCYIVKMVDTMPSAWLLEPTIIIHQYKKESNLILFVLLRSSSIDRAWIKTRRTIGFQSKIFLGNDFLSYGMVSSEARKQYWSFHSKIIFNCLHIGIRQKNVPSCLLSRPGRSVPFSARMSARWMLITSLMLCRSLKRDKEDLKNWPLSLSFTFGLQYWPVKYG